MGDKRDDKGNKRTGAKMEAPGAEEGRPLSLMLIQ